MNNMTTNLAKGFFLSIRMKMLISFVLLFIFALVSIELVRIYGIPFTDFSGEYKVERTRVFKNLNLVADLKKERISRWLKERKDDAKVIADSELIKTHLTELKTVIRVNMLDGGDIWTEVKKSEVFQSLHNHLNLVMNTYGIYSGIDIVDPQSGIVIASSQKDAVGLINQNLTDPLFTLNDYAIHAYKNPVDKFLDVDIYRQIKIKSVVIAVIAMHVNTHTFIQPLLHTRAEMGRSGEALLVDQDIRLLTSLKHALPDGTKPELLSYQIDAKPATFAAQGSEGIIKALDYRGVPVLAAYRHIRITPEVGWGLVVKRDVEEVFAPFKSKMVNSILIVFFVSIFVVLIILVVVRTILDPIMELSSTAQKIEKGDFDARAPVISSDEVGSLAITFNSMIQRIQNWYIELEEQVKDRTSQLNSANKKLSLEIVERNKAEEEIKFNSEILKNANEGIYVVGIDDSIIKYTNPEFEKMFGYNPGEMIGKDVSIVNTPTDKTPEETKNEIMNVLINTGEWHGEVKNIKKDGTHFWSYASVILFTYSKFGKILVSCNTNITERKMTEEKLKESEDRYRRITDTITDYIYSVRVEGGRPLETKHSDTCFAVTGYTSEEFDNDPYLWIKIIEEVDHDLIRQQIEQVLSGQLPKSIEHRMIRKDNVMCWVESTVVPNYDKDNNLISYDGIVKDITVRKKAEKTLRHTLEEKETLLQEVHHRVKNNLLVLYGLVDLQKARLSGKEDINEILDDVKQRINTMGKFHQMLYQSKNLSEINYSEYISSIVNEIKNIYHTDERKIDVSLNVESVIVGIKAAVPCGLIINELLVNAYKHAFPDRDGHIIVSFKKKDDVIELQISDDGVGMSEDSVFQEKGSLGLHLVTMLTRQLNGEITYKRENGSMFRIVFKII